MLHGLVGRDEDSTMDQIRGVLLLKRLGALEPHSQGAPGPTHPSLSGAPRRTFTGALSAYPSVCMRTLRTQRFLSACSELVRDPREGLRLQGRFDRRVLICSNRLCAFRIVLELRIHHGSFRRLGGTAPGDASPRPTDRILGAWSLGADSRGDGDSRHAREPPRNQDPRPEGLPRGLGLRAHLERSALHPGVRRLPNSDGPRGVRGGRRRSGRRRLTVLSRIPRRSWPSTPGRSTERPIFRSGRVSSSTTTGP